MSDRPGQLEVRDGGGTTIGHATVLVAPGASVDNGVASLPGISEGTVFGEQGANQVYAGPSSGASAIPSFRALVPADIPSLLASKISDFNAAADARITLQKGAASGLATLGSDSKIPTSQLPAIAITDTFVVASQAAMLALTAETGDVAVRTDLNKSFILAGTNPATLAHWQELLTPTDTVLSVNGQTGAVVLTTQHIAEHSSNLYHTSARVNTLIAAAVGVTVQAYDAGLAALAAFNTNGLLVQTADNTFAGRTLTGPAAGISVSNGNGVSGNPTLALANDLAAVEGLSSAGLAVRTGSDAWAVRSIAVPAAGLSITNADGSGGNPTLALANDLAALEGLGSTGIAVRTAADTWAQRSIAVTAGTGLAVSQGDGVAGNPTLSGVDASTTVKGVASFNSTNFSVASGAVNTAQNINTGASPSFVGLTLSGNLTTAGVASSLIPSLTDTYDLGSSTKLWRKGWLSELDAILFAQNTITLVGGWLRATKNEGAIPVGQDVEAGHTTIDFGQAMTTGDFVEFRSSLAVEYVQVGTVTTGTRYNVTRNLDGTGANAWPAGSVYAVNGQNGNGRIDINANSTPRISLIRQGATYNAQTELARLGDLNGNWGYSAETYGFAAGEYGSTAAGWITAAADGGGDAAKSGVRIGRNTTTYIHLKADGSGFLANSSISWDTAGFLTVAGSASIAGWTVNSSYLAKDTGTNSTSAGMSPTDYPFFAGATYANRAAAPFRVTPAGALTATNANVTGAITATSGSITGTMSVTGTLTAGGSAVTLDSSGISLAVGSGLANAVKWYSSGTLTADMFATYAGAVSSVQIESNLKSADTSGGASISLKASNNNSSSIAVFQLETFGSAGLANCRAALYDPSSTFVGLVVGGSGAPGAMLDVRGSGIFTGSLTVDTNTLVANATDNRVGIGTASPSVRLHVVGANDTEARITLDNTNAAHRVSMQIEAGVNEALFQATRLDASVVYPSFSIAVSATRRFTLSNAGLLRLSAYGAGTLTTDASGNVTASSDERLKDLRGPFAAGLDAVLQLEPVSFRWKHEMKAGVDYTYHGYTAQNVRRALPGAVGKNADGTLTVDRAVISAAHTNAIKELAARVAELEAQLAALR